MEREDIKGDLWFLAGCEHGEAERVVDKLLAEFDRLKLRVAELAADLWDANAALDEAQSWLGTISEPIKEWLKSIPPVSKSWDEHKTEYALKAMATIQAYLDSLEKKPRPADSQKTSENPTLRERLEYHTEHHEGKFLHCLICNPKQEQEK
jgi:hypothetical protein